MANYYVVGNSVDPSTVDLRDTPYHDQGYTVVTANQISSATDSTYHMNDGDRVVVSDTVDSHVVLQPSDAATDGYDLQVEILDNTHEFNVSHGVRVGGWISYTEPNLTINVKGVAENVSLGYGDRELGLTVELADNSAIGNIRGSDQAEASLTIRGGDNVRVGNVETHDGAATSDSIILGENSTIGNVALGEGNDTFRIGTGGTVGTLSTGGGDDLVETGARTTTGVIDTGTGNDNINIGGTTASVDAGSGTDSVHVLGTGTVGDVDLGSDNDSINVDGKAGYIYGSGGNDEITVNGSATGISGGYGNDIINVNASLTQADGTAGNIYGDITREDGNGSDLINLANGVRVGSVALGRGGDNGDTLIGGTGVTIDGGITQAVSDHFSYVQLGKNTTVTGDTNLHGGKDNLFIGENSSIAGSITMGEDGSADDGDRLEIGAGSVVEQFINTNAGDDTVKVGDNVTLNGGWNAINTEIGDDTLILGDNIVIPEGHTIRLGIGRDTVEGPGKDNATTYTIDGVHDTRSDRIVIPYHNEAGKIALEQELSRQGWEFDTETKLWIPDSGNEKSFVYNGVTYDRFYNIDTIPCFARGTMIRTDRGDVAIEDLSKGDLVLTADNGLQPIRWIGSKVVSSSVLEQNEKLRPIRIRAGSLGKKSPASDLVVSPQHRILVRSKIAQKMFGTDEVLVAAKQLLLVDGIDIATDMAEVEYFHMLFEQHEVVLSNGAETESLYTGPEALKSVGEAAREEIFTLFPELNHDDYEPRAARTLTSGRMGRKLAMRHVKNNKLLVAH